MKAGLGWIDKNTPELVALAQAIWEYAEVGFKEERARRRRRRPSWRSKDSA